MHLCCRGSHGDRGTEPSRGGWSCQGAVVDGGTGRTRCLNGVTDPRPRGGEGQQATARTDGGLDPKLPLARGERAEWRHQTTTSNRGWPWPAQPITPGQRSPNPPGSSAPAAAMGGHKPGGSEALPQGWPGFRPPGLGVFWFGRCHEALGAEQPLPWHRGGCTTVSHPPRLSHGHLRVLPQRPAQLRARTPGTETQQRMKNVSWVKEQKFGYPGGHLVKEEEEEEQGFGAVLLSP